MNIYIFFLITTTKASFSGWKRHRCIKFEIKHFRAKILLYFIHYRFESGGFVHSQISEHFTVEFDFVVLESVDKTAVIHAFGTGSCVNPGYPQFAEITFLVSPIPVGVLQSFLYGILGNRIHLGPGAKIPLRLL